MSKAMSKRIKRSESATNFIWTFFFGVALVCLLFFSSQTQATVGNWSQLGPWGSDQFRIYLDPVDSQKVYVVGNGIHRSLDGAESWNSLENPSTPIPGLLAYSLAIDHIDTQTLYLGTLVGVWKTINGGDSWNELDNGISTEDKIIRSVILDALNPNTIYISTSMFYSYSNARTGSPDKETTRAAYRSLDGGITWEPFDEGIPGPPAVTALFQDPITLDLYAATYGFGIFKFDPVLEVWAEKNVGLNLPEGLYVTYLEFDRNVPGKIFAGTQKDWLYKSENGGETWINLEFPEPLEEDYPPMAYNIIIDPNNSNVIWVSAIPGKDFPLESPFYQAESDQDVGGTFLSVDSGWTWTKEQIYPPAKFMNAGYFGITIDDSETVARDDNIFSKNYYIAGPGIFSVMKSTDGGENFNHTVEGLGGLNIDAFCYNPSDSSMLFAASEGVIHISFDRGENWSYFSPIIPDGISYLWDVQIDPINPDMLYYAVGEPAWDWPSNKGLYTVDISQLDPLDSTYLGPGELLPSTRGMGIWRIYLHPDGNLYLATQANGVQKSIDRGETLLDMSAGLTETSVTCLSFDDSFTPVYAGVRQDDGIESPYWKEGEPGGIYKWDPQQQSWYQIGEEFIQGAVFSIKTPPGDTDMIYVASVDGIFLSTDGGITWEKKDNGLPNIETGSFAASDIIIDPSNTNRIFISSHVYGVWASLDAGDHWFPFQNNLKRLMNKRLVLDAEPEMHLYATSLGASISQCEVGNLGEAPIVDHVVANEVTLSEPYSINIRERDLLEVQIQAHDPEGEPVTYAALYKGSTISAQGDDLESFTFDPATHTLRWIPPISFARPEPYKILLTVSDGVLTTLIDLDIFVGEIHPPVVEWIKANGTVLSKPYQVTLKEIETVEIQIEASDPDDDALTYEAYLDGGPVPTIDEEPESPFTFDPATRIFRFTPWLSSARPEPYVLTFVVEDGIFSTVAEVAITVTPQEPPYIEWIRANGKDLTEPYQTSVNEGELIEIQIEASDPEGEPLIYKAHFWGQDVPPPDDPDATFTFDPDFHTFRWILPYGIARMEPYLLYFLVSDGVLQTLTVVEIQVISIQKDAPEISLSINGEVFHPGDELQINMTLGNDYSPVTVDLYLAFGTPAYPLWRLIPADSPLITGLYMPYGLLLEDIPIIQFTFPSCRTSTSSELIFTMILVPKDGDIMETENWLSSDFVQFVFECP